MKAVISILLIVVSFKSELFAQKVITNNFESPNSSQISLLKDCNNSLYELKYEICSQIINNSQTPSLTPPPASKFRPTTWSFVSIVWGGFILYAQVFEGISKTSDAEKVVYSIMGVGFIVYGIIGSIDWE